MQTRSCRPHTYRIMEACDRADRGLSARRSVSFLPSSPPKRRSEARGPLWPCANVDLSKHSTAFSAPASSGDAHTHTHAHTLTHTRAHTSFLYLVNANKATKKAAPFACFLFFFWSGVRWLDSLIWNQVRQMKPTSCVPQGVSGDLESRRLGV